MIDTGAFLLISCQSTQVDNLESIFRSIHLVV